MAPKRKIKKPSTVISLSASPSSAFVQLKFPTKKQFLQKFGFTHVQINERQQLAALAKVKPIFNIVNSPSIGDPEMKTRGAWDKNLSNPNRISSSPGGAPEDSTNQLSTNSSRYSSPVQNGVSTPRPKGILKPPSTVSKRRQTTPATARKKRRVAINHQVDIVRSSEDLDDSEDSDLSDHSESQHNTDKENDMAERPKLKLKLGSIAGAPSAPPTQTPIPQSAIRTPSLKLSFNKPRIGGEPIIKLEDTNGDVPGSSAKKRKRESKAGQEDEEPNSARLAPIRKLTFKTNKPAQTPIAPMLKLKSKGKIPKRPLGVGYDSELEEREVDPVILEGFILRMQPGPDCDYLRQAIENGTMGIHRAQGGAHVSMRVLDTQARRGILMIKDNKYATTMVDLPCIIEGMKSWDKKNFMKSIDICQMMIVLGPCKTDDEARNYPLPPDVDPQTFQYAHGLTAPMKWVRKRRFARTKRARVDDIEAVERRVNALLDLDRQAGNSSYEVLDHDPRLDEPQYSASEESDAEGEDEDEVDDYFGVRNGHSGATETPAYETPEHDIGQEEVDEFERMFVDDDDNEATASSAHPGSTLHVPEGGESSYAVTSTSASPSAATATAVQTPASGRDVSSDEDDDDEDGERDEEEKDDDEAHQQVKGRIQDTEEKIAQQTKLFMQTQNMILRRKLAKKIEELKDDVKMMKKGAGIPIEEDEE